MISLPYRLARFLRDVEVLLSLNPVKWARRAKNKLLGRKLVAKLWRWP